jgi:hypothetical protein
VAKVESDNLYNKKGIWEILAAKQNAGVPLTEQEFTEMVKPSSKFKDQKDINEFGMDVASSTNPIGFVGGAIKGMNQIKAMHIADKIAGASGKFENYLQKLIENMNISKYGGKDVKQLSDLWGTLLLDKSGFKLKKADNLKESSADATLALMKEYGDEIIQLKHLHAKRPFSYKGKDIEVLVPDLKFTDRYGNTSVGTTTMPSIKSQEAIDANELAIKLLPENPPSKNEMGLFFKRNNTGSGAIFDLPISKPERGVGILAHELEHFRDINKDPSVFYYNKLLDNVRRTQPMRKSDLNKLSPEELIKYYNEFHHIDAPYGTEIHNIIKILKGDK